MTEAKNIVDFEKMNNKVNELKQLAERVDKNLWNMDNLISDTVGQNIGVWDGESAQDFLKEWKKISSEFPSYVDDFKKQIHNIEIFLENTSNHK